VDQALQAIANRRRRGMLQLVWDRERTASEIAAFSALSKPATSQHLRVLREAGLVRVRSAGNHRYYQADRERIAELRTALEGFWGDRLTRLRDELEADD
jgi:DNA-binding transcriptional ArsR family regulator